VVSCGRVFRDLPIAPARARKRERERTRIQGHTVAELTW
jgi:hypothetical protein